MTAQEQMRAMLDQLMGTGRDGENNKFRVSFTDPKVCKSFLIGCCPHDILASTRMDLGECPKIHDLALRADYEAASKKKEYYYDVEAMDHLQNFINDCDRRTVQARRKLSETQDELSCEASGKANIVHDLAEQIGKKLAKAEQMGAEGNVEESLRFMEEVEEIRQKKALAEQEYRSSMPASSYQQQKLRVCEVCSAYLGIHDNDRRLADHFGGKLHLGFITIREHLASLKELVQDKRMKNLLKDYIPDRLEDFEQSEKPRERERNSDEDRYRDRRSRDSNNRDRRRSRSRSRGHSSRKHRSRSRSRDRRRRSRSRSKRSSHRSDSRDHRRRRHSSDDD